METVDLIDNKQYLNEDQALDQIKQILNHPQLRDSERLKMRLLIYLRCHKPRGNFHA